ncbi:MULTISPECIES: LPD7 domain-containing protein [unclassified Sphingomonas]|uniref:LPD7 domain-containing protein n=1 Tax=unclassified Sphingomonas TaxID=196159 RepID=UPI0006F24317|nr:MULTISPECIES: LPD7 domain-containing protein [unclassified Sphingomonas]KRB78797.1 hypothetical protein ASE00_21455 [Sphingomonas sp. Root710]KRB93707.1 hypothetical protein ASE22_25225 [Sphingomonas sp. Root720]
MSAENSVARSGREADPQTERIAFEIPPELATRYEVRVVEGAGGGEQRLGLFRPGDRVIPAIEITDSRIVARREDAETIASLVKIAQHNSWDRIEVDGSPEFRKAVWSAATREGLTVNGYEPTFAEQERMADLRRGVPANRDATVVEQARPVPQTDAGAATTLTHSAPGQSAARNDGSLSEADRRLLLTLSRHTEDRKVLYGELGDNRDAFQREVHLERIDVNREALESALERALESPTLVRAFDSSGYESGALRQMGKGGAWDTEVADAIYLVRSGLHRDTMTKEAGAAATLADELDADREDRSVAEPTAPQSRRSDSEQPRTRDEQERDAAAGRRQESDELAELFLHGGMERVSAEPRLANALQAQAAMEQHIGEVFDGDAHHMVSANLESRKMISDVLRRGLDVSVREPTPVRQIEAMHTHPELER